MIPNVLSIAGVDPSGGAGVLADIKTLSAVGAYGCAVVTALTAQNTQGVQHIAPVPATFVGQQIDSLFTDLRIDSVKIGMLGAPPIIRIVTEKLAQWCPAHVVLDPVMVSKSGAPLLEPQAVGLLRETLCQQATLLTPNLPEASLLLEESPADSLKAMHRVAERLRRHMADNGHRWVMLKGGHLPGNESIDLLHDGDIMIELPSPRIATRHTHGTGCALSAALAAFVVQTTDIPTAAQRAKHYLFEAIRHADQLTVGTGYGPIHHFHAWW